MNYQSTEGHSSTGVDAGESRVNHTRRPNGGESAIEQMRKRGVCCSLMCDENAKSTTSVSVWRSCCDAVVIDVCDERFCCGRSSRAHARQQLTPSEKVPGGSFAIGPTPLLFDLGVIDRRYVTSPVTGLRSAQ